MPRLTSLSLDLWVSDCDTGKDAFSSIVAGNLHRVNRLCRLVPRGSHIRAPRCVGDGLQRDNVNRRAVASVCGRTIITSGGGNGRVRVDRRRGVLSVIPNRLSTLILGLDDQFVTDRDIKRLADAPTRTIRHPQMALDGNCISTVGLLHISRIVASARRRHCVFSLRGTAVSTYGRDALCSVGMWDTGGDKWVLLGQSPKVGTITNVEGLLCA